MKNTIHDFDWCKLFSIQFSLVFCSILINLLNRIPDDPKKYAFLLHFLLLLFFMSFETFQVFCLFIFSDLDKFIENQSKWSFIRALLCEVAIVSVIYWVVLRKNCQVAFVLLNLYSLCLFIIIKHLKKNTHAHSI